MSAAAPPLRNEAVTKPEPSLLELQGSFVGSGALGVRLRCLRITKREMRVGTFVAWQEKQIPPLAVAGAPAVVGMTEAVDGSKQTTSERIPGV
jgi:hypothetical protein